MKLLEAIVIGGAIAYGLSKVDLNIAPTLSVNPNLNIPSLPSIPSITPPTNLAIGKTGIEELPTVPFFEKFLMPFKPELSSGGGAR